MTQSIPLFSGSLPSLQTGPWDRASMFRSLIWHILVVAFILAIFMPQNSFFGGTNPSRTIQANLKNIALAISSGGGSNTDATPVSRGVPPPTTPVPLVSLKLPKLDDPEIPIALTIQGPNSSLIDHPIGLPDGAIGPPSLGNKCCNGLGNSPNGRHVGNDIGETFRLGGGITKPEPISTPEPTYTEEARKVHMQGVVVLHVIVQADGSVSHMSITRSLGAGLDEEALKTVKSWRFKPATKDGKPVNVWVDVEVNFQLF